MFETKKKLIQCVCVCVYSAGNICMFKSNEALKVSMDRSPVELNKTIDNINTFLTAVPQVREAPVLIAVYGMSEEIFKGQRVSDPYMAAFINNGCLVFS